MRLHQEHKCTKQMKSENHRWKVKTTVFQNELNQIKKVIEDIKDQHI
jgi:hypothetical protein